MTKLKVCWISAGISSFMAGYLAGDVDEWIYIDIADQHSDSMRYIKNCEKAIGKEIKILKKLSLIYGIMILLIPMVLKRIGKISYLQVK